MTRTAVEKLEAGLITESEARELAAAERAAIRAAGPLYVAGPRLTEAEAEARAIAEAATTGTDTTGKLALGAIVPSDTAEAEARAARAAKARAEAGTKAIEWIPAPIRKLTEAEEQARKAEQRWHASIARELARQEQAEARQAKARQARRDAVAGNAESMFAELAASPAELAEAARKARATGKLKAAEARAAFLAESGMTEEQARAEELLAESFEIVNWAAPGSLPTRKAKQDAGMDSRLSPAELAQVDKWTKAGLSSPAAEAGRLALEAIGPVASGMVITRTNARKVTIAKVCRVPKVEAAEARAARAADRLEAARARLAEAEAALAAAEATKARQPIRKAEAEANRLAEIVRKAAARAAKQDAMLAEARQLAARPASDGWVYLPVESFKLAEAWNAWQLELPARHDRMPAGLADRGPQAKGIHYVTDNTARLAIAELDKLTEAEIKAYWDETKAMIRQLLADKKAAEAAEAEAARAESAAARKAYLAAAARQRRARQRKAK